MLIPRVLLDALFPEAARRHLEGRGAVVRTGCRIDALEPVDGAWRLHAGADVHTFDAVVLAAPPWQAAALLRPLDATAGIVARLEALRYEPIATVYLQYAAGTRLPLPFCALVDAPAANRWGQFVFDRGQLDPGQDGLLAVVISAADPAGDIGQDALAAAVAAQLAAAFGQPALAAPLWSRTITEKRATFACTPGLDRPANATDLAGLALAGDYTACDYPSTLEAAVRSGVAAAAVITGGTPR
jgi:predicted NAD/FAD-dependent oxidoreductase